MFPLPDGRILLGGKFTQVNGQPRNRIAMINPDGSLADGFTCSVGGERVQTISRDSQGRFILGSESLYTVNGFSRYCLARINPDGSLDQTFNPLGASWVYSTAVLPDDSILVGGEFTTIGGGSAARFAKLDPDGNLAPGFVPPNPNDRVFGIVPLTDGNILISGSFSNLHPTGDSGPLNPAIRSLARVLDDGTVDLAFSPNPVNNSQTHALISESGRLFLAGNFNTVKSLTRIGLAEIENRFTNSSLWVDENGRIEWIRSGALAEPTHVTFDVSTDGGVTWDPLGEATRILGSSGWELAGSGLPGSGKIRARARFTYGYEGSSSLTESISDYV
ncbi:MAG: delta-60 repeat domain-containing protein, partial [Verrucomicrobiae bacterium]|nr:delta-60 repeat domain-containing protein [Verrucomicrobiae bacterium]